MFCMSEDILYIDKTALIEKTNAALNTRQKYLCVSRPRRFGKSMAADMLTAYEDILHHKHEVVAVYMLRIAAP